MDTDFDTLAEKVAEYIGTVQPQLDKLDKLEKFARDTTERDLTFVKRATEVLKSLSNAGFIPKTEVTPFVEKVAEDHACAWDLMEKIAASAAPSDIGTRSNETDEASVTDPWLKEFGNFTTNANNGMID